MCGLLLVCVVRCEAQGGRGRVDRDRHGGPREAGPQDSGTSSHTERHWSAVETGLTVGLCMGGPCVQAVTQGKASASANPEEISLDEDEVGGPKARQDLPLCL